MNYSHYIMDPIDDNINDEEIDDEFEPEPIVNTKKEVLLNFVLVGHVDHGKSTCAGRILVDTNTVTDNMIRKAQQDAEDNKMRTWWLAYLLDENAEERVNGKTHEYMIKEIERESHMINMIDVPGHNQFITQMIYGTAKADVVVLICSAKTGEFEKGLRGQTYEHLILSRSMGIGNLIVAINKMDTVGKFTDGGLDDDGQKVYEDIKGKITAMIKKLRFKNVYFVPVSAFYGTNVVRPMAGYPSLFDTIENTKWDKKVIVPTITTDKFKAKCIFMNIKTLVTTGFSAVLHSGSTISEFTLSSITTSRRRPFITAADTDYVDIEVELPEKKKLESYIILRTSECTIAIGRICQ